MRSFISFIPHRIPAALDRSIYLKQDTIDVPIRLIDVSEGDLVQMEFGIVPVSHVESELIAFIRCNRRLFLDWMYECATRVLTGMSVS